MEKQVLQGEVVEEKKVLTARQKYANALRELAKFFDEHEEVPIPNIRTIFNLWNLPVESVPIIARAFGQAKKEYIGDSLFVLKRTFGEAASLEANWNRERVCTRVVVGQKQVVEKVPVAFEEVNKTVDVVEWRCSDPVLAPKVVTAALPELSNDEQAAF